MSKIVLDDTAGGYNLSKINSNFQKIEDALNNEVLYRDNPLGEPNTLETAVDANNQRIINLPAPLLPSEPARLQDLANIAATLGLLFGTGIPSISVGVDGNYYLRTDTPGTPLQRIYVKTSGVWTGIL